ncbi:MAG: samA [Flaviaesturariibacter sp.]|nr:samA [Flaviaesturariibacter sp.]
MSAETNTIASNLKHLFTLPLFTGIQAGLPAPSGDYFEREIDLNELLIDKPAATFYIRVTGDSMDRAYVPPGALVMIDRSITPCNGSIVLAVVDGEFTLKRLEIRGTQRRLCPDSNNPKHKPVDINEFTQCEIWGVARHLIIDAKTV